jgi:predicted 3-demethylubiquinone-9 3-methyltransferase (glyoxalase superfamily)
MRKISTFLWFDSEAEEAARFYTSLFDDSRILGVNRYGESGPGAAGGVMTVEFELAGQRFVALNGGPAHPLTEAVSIYVDCVDQAEVDALWEKLTADGGEPGPCAWLKDRYGLSWQIVPRALVEMLGDPDPARSARVVEAMMSMTKIDVQALRDAYAGVSTS